MPCRGFFSDMETRCHFLCDCYEDDFRWIARKMMAADAVIFATPTYMGGMSAVLKMFFERWISFKAPPVDSSRANKSLEECFALIEDRFYADRRCVIERKTPEAEISRKSTICCLWNQ